VVGIAGVATRDVEEGNHRTILSQV
jgi:hypothetical protein